MSGIHGFKTVVFAILYYLINDSVQAQFQPLATALIPATLLAFDGISCSPNPGTTVITGQAITCNINTYSCPNPSGGHQSSAFSACTQATTAFNTVSGQSCTPIVIPPSQSAFTLNLVELDGGILTPGTYCVETGVHVLVDGILTLDYQNSPTATFSFFNMFTFTMTSGSSVVAINDGGTGACRAYWASTEGMLFDPNAIGIGTFMTTAQNPQLITVQTGTNIVGRLFSIDYALILENNIVSIGPCGTTFCFPNPCLNGGTCSGDNVCTCPADNVCHCSGSTCQICDAGYVLFGSTCVVNHCLPTNPCAHGGTCTPTASSFTCTCPTGYNATTQCTTCSIGFIMHGGVCVPNGCAISPCLHGGVCMEVGGNFTGCSCRPHFIGTFCSGCSPSYNLTINSTCVFNDMCSNIPPRFNPCLHNGNCTQNVTAATISCVCVGNFVGSRCTTCRLGYNLVGSACVFGGFTCSPPVANRDVVHLLQGPTTARPFKLNITHFPFFPNGCNDINDTLGAIITTLPTRGYLLVLVGPSMPGAYNIIGVVPYYIANISATQLYFWPASQFDFGSPPSYIYSQFAYIGTAGFPNTPSFRQSANALVIINLNATNLPPVAVSATYTIPIDSSITITLQGTNPNDVLGRLTIPWLAHGIPSAQIVTLPVNGGSLRRTPTSPALILANLPAQIGPPPPLYVTYVAESIPLPIVNGSNIAIQDLFDFTVSNGVQNSIEPGLVTVNVVNPLQFIPSTNFTQEIRTGIRSQVKLGAINLLHPNATIGFKIVTLPIAGTLYILINGSYVKATSGFNGSANFIGRVYGSKQFYYQPFPDTVGFNADFIELRLVNISDGFTSGIGFHFFWIVDPPVWEAPAKQPLQTFTCGSPLTCGHPLLFTMKLINGDSGTAIGTLPLLPALIITMRSNFGLGALLIDHPELASEVTFLIGTMGNPGPLLSFTSSRTVANLMMVNITFTSPLALLETVIFTAQDTDNGTVYTVSNTVSIQVNPVIPTPSSSSSSIWNALTIGLTVVVIAVPICCAIIVWLFLMQLCGISSAMNKEDAQVAKQQKQAKQSKKAQTKAKRTAAVKAKASKVAAQQAKKSSSKGKSLLTASNVSKARFVQQHV